MKSAVLFETIGENNVILKISSHTNGNIVVGVAMADRAFNMIKIKPGLWKISSANDVLDLLPIEKSISAVLDAAGY